MLFFELKKSKEKLKTKVAKLFFFIIQFSKTNRFAFLNKKLNFKYFKAVELMMLMIFSINKSSLLD